MGASSRVRRELVDLLSTKASIEQAQRHSAASQIATVLSPRSNESAGGSTERAQFEAKVKDCQLEDFKLEYCTRRVLGLSMSVGTLTLNGKCNWAEAGKDFDGFISGSW